MPYFCYKTGYNDCIGPCCVNFYNCEKRTMQNLARALEEGMERDLRKKERTEE